MRIRGRDIGICSWSLQTTQETELVETLVAVGLTHLQLDLRPYLDGADAAEASRRFAAAGVTITAGMVGFVDEDYSTIAAIRETGGLLPDALAAERIARAVRAARVARSSFGLAAVSAHAGFLPSAGSKTYQIVQQRIREIAAAYAELGMTLLFETGQETAGHLRFFLDDLACSNVRANLDPANMILYGAGDPVAAVRTLGPWIGHVHVKDAVPSDHPGEQWGTEVAAGDGRVDWRAFLEALDEVAYRGPLVIEREAGGDRVGDIRRAILTLRATESAGCGSAR